MKTKILFCVILSISTFAQTPIKDIKYASTPQKELFLDLYMSEKVQNPPLLVWVHGGAWSAGSKENPPMELLAYGFAMASIEYRLSGEAPFPAQIRIFERDGLHGARSVFGAPRLERLGVAHDWLPRRRRQSGF